MSVRWTSGAIPISPSRTAFVPHRADREDRDLRRVEDRCELLDAEHAEFQTVSDPALEVGRQVAVAGAPDEVGAGPTISCTVRRSAWRTTGTTSPCGAATAIPTFAVRWRWISCR